MCWTTSTWTLHGESRRGGHDALDVAHHEQSRRMRWQTCRCRSWRCETLCVQRDISQFGIGLCTSLVRLDSLMLDDNLRQDHTSKQCYLPKDVFAKGNESSPSGKSAAFFIQIVGEISWHDRRSDDCGVWCGAHRRTRRQCTTSTSCFEPLCCCVASGATCSSQWR